MTREKRKQQRKIGKHVGYNSSTWILQKEAIAAKVQRRIDNSRLPKLLNKQAENNLQKLQK